MKLSAKGRYAVRAMLFLAEKEQAGPQSLGLITSIGLPRDYMEQLLGVLRRSGLIAATRGAQGGYFLARPAAEISLGQVIEAVEGPVTLCDCALDQKQCDLSSQCALRGAFLDVAKGINDLMENFTLRDMLSAQNQMMQEAGTML